MDRTRFTLVCLLGVVLPVAGTVALLAWHADSGEAATGVTAVAGPARAIAVMAVLVAAAHLGGWVASRLGQPRVIGQSAVGLALGPSLLARVAPGAAGLLHAGGVDASVDLLANLGVILFAFVVARELAEGGRIGGLQAVGVGSTMVAVPLLAGVALSVTVLSPQPAPLAHTLFIGLAMSTTALPVLAHILSERRILTSRVGALGVASAAVGDAAVWGLLALTLCLRNHGSPVTVMLRLAAGAAMAAVMWWGVRPLLRSALTAARDSAYTGPALLFAGLLVSAFLTDAVGLHPIFGAFLFGLAVPGHSAITRRAIVTADSVAQLLLLPLFFTSIGERADVTAIARPTVLGAFVLILLVAAVSKVGSGGWTGRMAGLSWRESAALGVMLSCRGLTELVILNIGLTAGLIDPTTFTAFLVMALITTAATGPLLSLLGLRGQPAGAATTAEPVQASAA